MVPVERLRKICAGLQRVQNRIADVQGEITPEMEEKVKSFLISSLGCLSLVSFPIRVEGLEVQTMLVELARLRELSNEVSAVHGQACTVLALLRYVYKTQDTEYRLRRSRIMNTLPSDVKGVRVREAAADNQLMGEIAKMSRLERLIGLVEALVKLGEEKLKLLSKTSYEFQQVFNTFPDRKLSMAHMLASDTLR